MGITDRRVVFLDRDGVINRPVIRDGRPFAPAAASEVELLPGVLDAVARLRARGYYVIVVTNQPEVARGTVRLDTVEQINDLLKQTVGFDDIRVCVHDDSARCTCRKPQPGMLLDAAASAALPLEGSFMIGDRWRDIEAGERAGCRTIFIDWGYDEPRPPNPDVTVKSLPEAVDWILSTQQAHEGN